MGASEFAIDNFGRNLSEAYNKQVDSDYYDHGHAGYTGTLVEKDGCVLIDRPPRITATRLSDTIAEATHWWWWLDTEEKYRHLHDKPSAKYRQAWDRLNKWFPSNPGTGKFFVKDHAYGVEASDICRLYDDKWGPAFAVEQSPAEKKKRWHDLPRGSKTFLFFGNASC